MTLPHVSDHAVLCYLERVHEIDVEAIRLAIGAACERGAEVNAPCVRIAAARFIVKRGTVVTALSATTLPKHGFLQDIQAGRDGKGGGR